MIRYGSSKLPILKDPLTKFKNFSLKEDNACAAKISSALQSAILGHEMAMRGIRFEAGDGIVMENAEDTVKAVGYMGKNGMKQTDVEILNLMIGKTKLS